MHPTCCALCIPIVTCGKETTDTMAADSLVSSDMMWMLQKRILRPHGSVDGAAMATTPVVANAGTADSVAM